MEQKTIDLSRSEYRTRHGKEKLKFWLRTVGYAVINSIALALFALVMYAGWHFMQWIIYGYATGHGFVATAILVIVFVVGLALAD